MEPASRANTGLQTLEGQIRECFGRVVYSHKTHERCADIYLARLACLKTCQIAVSAIVTGSLLANVFGKVTWVTIAGAVLSGILLFLNTYFKNYDLGQLAERHKETADKLWMARESYLSLLTDISALNLSAEDVVKRRDQLQKELSTIYKAAPKTTSKAYKQAQQALQVNEDLTFSDKEIDAFLPSELKRVRDAADKAKAAVLPEVDSQRQTTDKTVCKDGTD